MDLMELVGMLEGYINLLIPVVFAVILQIVKVLLANRGVKFKNPDNWLWIILGLGFLMSWIDYSIKQYDGFSAGGFILLAVIYAALAAFFYKVGKVGGKSIVAVFGRKKGAGHG